MCGGATCIDLQSDTLHCGSCNQACSGAENCENGACFCPAGAAVCGGVCTDISTNVANCGHCGAQCPAGDTCGLTELFIAQDGGGFLPILKICCATWDYDYCLQNGGGP